MGEISDMMMEGFLDEETGEVIDGDAPGHPRTVRDSHIRRGGHDKPFKCAACGKGFFTEQGRSDHAKAKHQHQ